MDLEDTIHNDVVVRDIMALKKRYQTTIRKLLDCSTYAGVTFQELGQFKEKFRTSAFTCQIWSCSHSVFGLNSIDHLTLHEKNHLKHVCLVSGCQYPVFSSAKKLKDHVAKVHFQSSQAAARKSIRKHVKINGSSSQEDSHPVYADPDPPGLPAPSNISNLHLPNFVFTPSSMYADPDHPKSLSIFPGLQISRSPAREPLDLNDFDFDFDTFINSGPLEEFDFNSVYADTDPPGSPFNNRT
jgi:hypothetical protein